MSVSVSRTAVPWRLSHESGLNVSFEPHPRTSFLLVKGENRPNLGDSIADRLSDKCIDVSFVRVEITDSSYIGVFGFASEDDANEAFEVLSQVF